MIAHTPHLGWLRWRMSSPCGIKTLGRRETKGGNVTQAMKLSLEQEFQLKKFSDHVQTLSLGEAQELLIELNRQIMIKDNLYKQLLMERL